MRISLESLSKRYGPVRVLDNATLTIEPGKYLPSWVSTVRAKPRCFAASAQLLAPRYALVHQVTGMLGQPRRFILTGDDKKPVALGKDVPFPAAGNDNQCSVEALILQPNASAVLLIGLGFVPGEEVKDISSSRGEVIPGSLKADENGRVLRVDLPFVKVLRGRTDHIYLSRLRVSPRTTFN